MNGIEKIVARMETDAEAERTALQAETAAQCEALRAEYEEKAQKEYSDRLQKGMEECRARAERLAGTADMEARKSILNFKQNMISDIFKDAERQLAALGDLDERAGRHRPLAAAEVDDDVHALADLDRTAG